MRKDPDRYRLRNSGAPPPAAVHWTPRGVFRIEQVSLCTGRWAMVFLDGRGVDFANDYLAAATDLAEGKYDAKLGFSARPLGIPPDPLDWIDPLDALDVP